MSWVVLMYLFTFILSVKSCIYQAVTLITHCLRKVFTHTDTYSDYLLLLNYQVHSLFVLSSRFLLLPLKVCSVRLLYGHC